MATKPRAERAYDEFAKDWDEARQKPFSAMALFAPAFRRRLGPKRCKVLDAGCGNGRNSVFIAGLSKNAVFSCVDVSEKMLENARANAEKNGLAARFSFKKARVEKLPFKRGFFDAIISIAVLHHLDSPKKRACAMREMFRTLKGGGFAYATAWNKSQEKFRKVAGKDALVPWKSKEGRATPRYYHFYSKKELATLAEKAGFEVKAAFFEKNGKRHSEEGAANICLVLQKP